MGPDVPGRRAAGVAPWAQALALAALAALAPAAAGAEAAAPPGEAGDEVEVDRVLAVVGGAGDRGRDLRIVTAFELEVETALVIAERAHTVDVVGTVRPPQRLLDAVLETIISHLLIEEEAAGLDLDSASDAEVAAERAALEARLGGAGSLARFGQALGAPADLVDAIVRRRALVSAFVRSNFQFGTSVTDLDVDDAYRRGEHPFGDRPLEEIRPSLEAYIVATRQREQLSQWLREARRRSRVWIIPP
jgi:hypothetical protein